MVRPTKELLELKPQHPFEAVLRQSPLAALRTVDVEATDDRVILTGQVGSYYFKQLAQEAINPVRAGRQIVNNIVVRKRRRVSAAS